MTDFNEKATGQQAGLAQPFISIKTPDLVVFSHLRWEFVTQRPQHLISRLAAGRKVLFVEEPLTKPEWNSANAHTFRPQPEILVIQPYIDPNNLIDQLTPVVQHFIQQEGLDAPVLWFYSAAFHEMTSRLDHSLVVYDCMDELSAFRGAPAQLIEQERRLLEKAHVVFTGGKSLYEAKRSHAESVYCYPSSVDKAHFEQTKNPNLSIPDDIAAIPHPIIGYYGVIDERIDYPLLAAVAAANPNKSFVMIGPVVKVRPDELPLANNLYYLGGKPYSELPAYLKAFDVAMMPFALNESTRYISPTKTLEFFAGGKPVVSTPVYDVERDYSTLIPIVSETHSFTAAIERFLQETPEARDRRLQAYENVLQNSSWDRTATNMLADLQAVLSSRKTPA